MADINIGRFIMFKSISTFLTSISAAALAIVFGANSKMAATNVNEQNLNASDLNTLREPGVPVSEAYHEEKVSVDFGYFYTVAGEYPFDAQKSQGDNDLTIK